MSRISNTFNMVVSDPPPPPSGNKGEVGRLAAALLPGEIAHLGQTVHGVSTSAPTLVGGGTWDAGFFNSGSGSVLMQSARLAYDPTHNVCYHVGGSHGDPIYWIRYDMGTNQWSRTSSGLYNNIGPFSGTHGWEFMTCRTTQSGGTDKIGDLFFREYATGAGYQCRVWRLPYALTATPANANWTMLPTFFAADTTGACDWWPQMNGGTGGIIISDQTGCRFSTNADGTTWSGNSCPDDIGHVEIWGAITNGYYCWGGGVGGTVGDYQTAWYRAPVGNLAAAPTRFTGSSGTPQPAHVGGAPAPPIPHPNGTDLILFPSHLGGNGSNDGFYRGTASAATPSWTFLFNGTTGAPWYGGASSYFVAATMYDLGVIMVVHAQGWTAGGAAYVTLYKPPV